jgi:hypothetical protein
MQRVGRLIEGFETPLGMELLATVHWVATNQCLGKDLDCVMNGIAEWEPQQPSWNARKQALMPRPLVAAALKRLEQESWLEFTCH